MTGIVIYATKYGSTGEYASLVAEKLGIGAVRASEAVPETILRADFLVLGSPIYAYSVLPEMEAFLEPNQEFLSGKPLAAFVVCGDTLWNPKAGEEEIRIWINLSGFFHQIHLPCPYSAAG